MIRQCAQCGRDFEWEPTGRGGRPPLTCSPECQTARLTHQKEASRGRFANQPVPLEYHGTATGYFNYKCGCRKCTKWARDYKQERREAKRRKPD
jgi:hypothetical protein